MVKRTKDNFLESGFSLTELLIVLSITAIIIVFSVAQFGNATEIFETQNAARELKVNLERARSDSVKRRPSTTAEMSSVSIDSATQMTVRTDRNQNGRIESAESQTIDFSMSGNAKIVSSTLSFPVTVSFDRRGAANAVDSGGIPVDPIFIVCNGCSISTLESSEFYIVTVSATGTVSMYDNGEGPGNPIDPTITAVADSSDIDPMVAVDTGGPPPAGTPVPTPTPNVPLVPLPTGIPIEAPEVPLPSPLPDFCERNERPSTSGCICLEPMRILPNGKCR